MDEQQEKTENHAHGTSRDKSEHTDVIENSEENPTQLSCVSEAQDQKEIQSRLLSESNPVELTFASFSSDSKKSPLPMETDDCSNECSKDCTDMCSESDESPSDGVLRLDLLPLEIILHVASFLDSKFVICVMSKVCHAFHSLVADSAFWKMRMRKQWPRKYPAIPVKEEEFDWKRACVERELQHQRWSDVTKNMEFYTFKEGIFGAVDAVHLMEHGNLLAVGSRDRYFNLLDLTKLDKNDPQSSVSCRTFCKINAHDGWIWSITSHDKTVATGSWDTRIKFWDLTTMEQIHEAKAHSAILCSHFESNIYIAGSYDKNIYQFDPRAVGFQHKKRYHTKPILCLAVNDDYIISGSEDATVALYDRRASSVIKKQKLPLYPMSMSYDDGQLWVGDKGGSVHLLDARHGDLSLVKTFNVGHAEKVTGIIHTPGALFTCSTDKTVKVLEPSLDPRLITNLTDIAGEVADISYQDGTLACASSAMFVGIYRLKA